MIKIEHLVKNYGSNCAVDDISIEIQRGEIVGFLGPNGAGKSTTMNILTGYLSATEGTVEVAGVNILDDPREAKKHIGYLPEQPPLYLDMTVEEYLNFSFELKACKLNKKEHLAEICEVVKIKDVYKRLIKNLSKGYRQRVGIAQALIGNPEIIIFDEPTVGLDPKQIIEVRNLLRSLGKSHTVILSTHILAEVQAVCERVIIINKGNIIADAKTEEIARTIKGGYNYRLSLVGNAREITAAIKGIGGVRNITPTGERDGEANVYILEADRNIDVRKSVFALCASRGFAIFGLEPEDADLESVFIKLVDSSDGYGADEGKRQRRM
jgi:ABC-2 type transport system ATP-binding protein